MTARELAECLEVSERTIYRDIEALSSAGIPVYTEPGPGGGCELVNGYQTKLTGLTRTEVRALFLLKISGPLFDLGLGQALEDALLKLSAVLPPAFRADAIGVHQRIYMDTTLSDHPHRILPYLELLQGAVWQDRTLCLSYGRYSRQQVDPYGLVFHNRTWYLVGAVEGEMHIMHVSRIRDTEMTEQHFVRPAEFDLATYWKEHHPPRLLPRPSYQRRKKREWARTYSRYYEQQKKKTRVATMGERPTKKTDSKKHILKLENQLHAEGISKLLFGDAIQANRLIIAC